MATVKVTGMNVLALYTEDLDEAVAFLSGHLGFEREGGMEPGVLLRAGDSTVYVEGGHGGRSTGPGGFVPCFAVEHVRAAHDALRDAGVRVTRPYVEYAPTFGMFRIEGPVGSEIEFAGEP